MAPVVPSSRPPDHNFQNSHGRRGSSYSTPLFSEPSVSSKQKKDEDKTLAPSKIAELVEVAFLQSCLQLSQGYVDVLKLFIVAVKSAFEYPLRLEELHALVEACPLNSAGRELAEEEKGLRLEWMRMVYETMTALNDPDAERSGDDGDAASLRISAVMQAMLSIQSELQNEETITGGKQDATVAMNKLTVGEVLTRSPSLSTLNDSIADPMEKAFLTNDIRVALMTFRVLEEERVCTQGASGNTVKNEDGDNIGEEVPRPPIPGT